MNAASPAALLPLLLADVGLPEPAGREPADWALGWHYLRAADWRCEQAALGWPGDLAARHQAVARHLDAALGHRRLLKHSALLTLLL